MSKFRNYALAGAFGLAAFASIAQISFNDAPRARSVPKHPTETETEAESELPPRTGSTIIEQAIFDSFPLDPQTSPEGERKRQNAADYLAGTINSQGHLCAEPIEVQKASAYMYGIGCISRRDGSGKSNYLLNVRTGEVTPI